MLPRLLLSAVLALTLAACSFGSDEERQEQLAALQAEVESLAAQRDAATRRIDDLESRMEEFAGDLDRADDAERLDRIATELETVGGRIDDAEERFSAADGSVDEVAEALERTGSDLRALLSDLGGEVNGLRGEIDELRGLYTSLRDRLDRCQQQSGC